MIDLIVRDRLRVLLNRLLPLLDDQEIKEGVETETAELCAMIEDNVGAPQGYQRVKPHQIQTERIDPGNYQVNPSEGDHSCYLLVDTLMFFSFTVQSPMQIFDLYLGSVPYSSYRDIRLVNLVSNRVKLNGDLVPLPHYVFMPGEVINILLLNTTSASMLVGLPCLVGYELAKEE